VRALNIAAMIIGGILLLRRLALMDRYFEARVIVITLVLCGAFLVFVLYCFTDPPCVIPPPGTKEFYFCTEY
jgi:hypothetical protein